jgi:hypothetical protein
MKERQRNELPQPVHVQPNDWWICEIQDRKTGKVYAYAEKIARKMTIDTVVTFDLDEPALGLKAGGIGALFGEQA